MDFALQYRKKNIDLVISIDGKVKHVINVARIEGRFYDTRQIYIKNGDLYIGYRIFIRGLDENEINRIEPVKLKLDKILSEYEKIYIWYPTNIIFYTDENIVPISRKCLTNVIFYGKLTFCIWCVKWLFNRLY